MPSLSDYGGVELGENLHAGHRARVKQDFLRNGFDEQTPLHKILELLLFYCVPQKDTNELAHQLENRYRTLSGVLGAPVEELIQFNGLTESNVVLLKLILPLARRCFADISGDANQFGSLDQIGKYLLGRFFGLMQERLGVLCLDNRCRMIDFRFIESGDLSSVGVSNRKIVEYVLKTGANCAVIAHNHPGGIALPSSSDIAMTRSVAGALNPIGVRLLDHVIVARNDFVSLAQSEEFRDIFKG